MALYYDIEKEAEVSFSVVKLLNHGHFCYVYEVKDELNRVMVGKTSRHKHKVFSDDIMNEINVLSKFRGYIGVVQMLGCHININEAKIFIMLEKWSCALSHYIDIDAKKKSLVERIKIAYQVAQQIGNSLSFLHHNGYIHGDLKDNNILMKHKGNGKYNFVLTDFGASSFIYDPFMDCHIIASYRTDYQKKVSKIEFNTLCICIINVLMACKYVKNSEHWVRIKNDHRMYHNGKFTLNVRSMLFSRLGDEINIIPENLMNFLQQGFSQENIELEESLKYNDLWLDNYHNYEITEVPTIPKVKELKDYAEPYIEYLEEHYSDTPSKANHYINRFMYIMNRLYQLDIIPVESLKEADIESKMRKYRDFDFTSILRGNKTTEQLMNNKKKFYAAHVAFAIFMGKTYPSQLISTEDMLSIEKKMLRKVDFNIW